MLEAMQPVALLQEIRVRASATPRHHCASGRADLYWRGPYMSRYAGCRTGEPWRAANRDPPARLRGYSARFATGRPAAGASDGFRALIPRIEAPRNPTILQALRELRCAWAGFVNAKPLPLPWAADLYDWAAGASAAGGAAI